MIYFSYWIKIASMRLGLRKDSFRRWVRYMLRLIDPKKDNEIIFVDFNKKQVIVRSKSDNFTQSDLDSMERIQSMQVTLIDIKNKMKGNPKDGI